MRDAARIDPLIERLRIAWKSTPDLRLAQLIQAGAMGDPFYTEDESLMQEIEATLHKSGLDTIG